MHCGAAAWAMYNVHYILISTVNTVKEYVPTSILM